MGEPKGDVVRETLETVGYENWISGFFARVRYDIFFKEKLLVLSTDLRVANALIVNALPKAWTICHDLLLRIAQGRDDEGDACEHV
ncbi:MAG: hypothetical protein ETSY1_07430 [Candidatus Entotheonella factor]|uniref:Uncharacterized protein n=1 Tax=Entotheonella factor TaxID=1429438 RepID=W4LUS2_ENTF1|nr:MAG: hypothetical protein ETSY1_07430 [Candidatus Entotheonella factor]